MLPLDPPLAYDAVRSEAHPLRTLSVQEREAFARARQDPSARGTFARQVLERNPDSMLGRMMLAEAAPTSAEAEALLRDAVRIGMKLWQPELAGRVDVDWYDDKDTRLFMAAVLAYGRTLCERGLTDEARQCADFLLVLDPRDRLQVEEGVMGPAQSSSAQPKLR